MSVATTIRPRSLKAVPFVYLKDDPMPIDADPVTIGILAKTRGTVAESELSGVVITLDAELLSVRAGMTDAPSIRTGLPIIEDISARRAIYATRLAILRRALGIKAPALSKPPEISEFVRILAESSDGQAIRTRLVAEADRVRGDLDHTEGEIDDLTEVLGDDERYVQAGQCRGQYREKYDARLGDLASQTAQLKADLGKTVGGSSNIREPLSKLQQFRNDAEEIYSQMPRLGQGTAGAQWPQDLIVARLDIRVRKRKALTARLASLDGDARQTTAVVAERVKRAVEAAGGVSIVTLDIASASHLSGKLPPFLVSLKNRITDGLARVRGINGELEELTATVGEFSSASTALKARREEAMAALTTARQEFSAGHYEYASAMVNLAISGDETARSSIEALTSACPEAFPAGFPAAIAGARFDRAVADELQRVLSTASDPQAN